MCVWLFGVKHQDMGLACGRTLQPFRLHCHLLVGTIIKTDLFLFLAETSVNLNSSQTVNINFQRAASRPFFFPLIQ